MDRCALLERARRLPIGGSLTFKALVLQRNWFAVRKLIRLQEGLSESDRLYLRREAWKDREMV